MQMERVFVVAVIGPFSQCCIYVHANLNYTGHLRSSVDESVLKCKTTKIGERYET